MTRKRLDQLQKAFFGKWLEESLTKKKKREDLLGFELWRLRYRYSVLTMQLGYEVICELLITSIRNWYAGLRWSMNFIYLNCGMKKFTLFIYTPIIVKINIVHLVFLSIHEQEISAQALLSFQTRDPLLYLWIKLLTHCLVLNITIKTLPNFNEMMQVY